MVVGAFVVGAFVVGAFVVGAFVVGAFVVGAFVVGAFVVGAVVVGAFVGCFVTDDFAPRCSRERLPRTGWAERERPARGARRANAHDCGRGGIHTIRAATGC